MLRKAFHESLNLNAAEQTVLSFLFYEPPASSTHAAENSRGWATMITDDVFPTENYAAAIDQLVDRELVCEITTENLRTIIDFMEADPAIGPLDGFPPLGTLQFALKYVLLLQQFLRDNGRGFDDTWMYDVLTDERQLVYGTTRLKCLEFLRDQLSPDDDDWKAVLKILGPYPCGPWRSKWWCKYDSGHTIEILRCPQS